MIRFAVNLVPCSLRCRIYYFRRSAGLRRTWVIPASRFRKSTGRTSLIPGHGTMVSWLEFCPTGRFSLLTAKCDFYVFRYFCPLPTCGYEGILRDRRHPPVPFSSGKCLLRHFTKGSLSASLSFRQKSANSLQMSLALRSPLCSPVQPLAPLVHVSGAAVGTSPLHRSAS